MSVSVWGREPRVCGFRSVDPYRQVGEFFFLNDNIIRAGDPEIDNDECGVLIYWNQQEKSERKEWQV